MAILRYHVKEKIRLLNLLGLGSSKNVQFGIRLYEMFLNGFVMKLTIFYVDQLTLKAKFNVHKNYRQFECYSNPKIEEGIASIY